MTKLLEPAVDSVRALPPRCRTSLHACSCRWPARNNPLSCWRREARRVTDNEVIVQRMRHTSRRSRALHQAHRNRSV